MAKYTDKELAAWGITSVPRHIGIIMDGNGRWAKNRGLARSLGHRAAMEGLNSLIRFSSDMGCEALSLYAFSTENWNRPEAEVSGLFSLLVEYFFKDIDELDENNVRICELGDPSPLPPATREAIEKAIERTKGNTGLALCLAVNYGGRAEAVRACRMIACDAAKGKLSPDDVDEALLMSRLYTAGLPDVDLLIRTGGELRTSNFLPLQTIYAELYFTDTWFPDFTVDEYKKALADFSRRQRRFGRVPV